VRGIYRLAVQLLASEQGLCSMQTVKFLFSQQGTRLLRKKMKSFDRKKKLTVDSG
jgi:hypothetical protein